MDAHYRRAFAVYPGMSVKQHLQTEFDQYRYHYKENDPRISEIFRVAAQVGKILENRMLRSKLTAADLYEAFLIVAKVQLNAVDVLAAFMVLHKYWEYSHTLPEELPSS